MISKKQFCIGASLLFSAGNVLGQIPTAEEIRAIAEGAGGGNDSSETKPSPKNDGDFNSFLNDLLKKPETIDFLSKKLLDKDGPLGSLADDFTLRAKTFQSNGETSIGINWEYQKNINHHEFSGNDAQQLGLILDLKFEGNVAFEEELNPRDFLKAQTSFSFYRSTGGLNKVKGWTDLDARNLLNQVGKLADIEDPEELLKARKRADDSFRKHLSSQFYFEAGADIGYEADQSFDNQQWTIGGHAALDIKAWNRDSALAKFNFLDYPFAVTRLLTGTDDEFRPSGAALPTFLIGLDQVVPTAESGLLRGGDTSDFLRFRAEVASRFLVADFNNEPIFFEASAKFHQEISPSDVVKVAEEDEHFLFTAALLLSNNTYISYSTGRLPFDLKDSKVFELGFNYEF